MIKEQNHYEIKGCKAIFKNDRVIGYFYYIEAVVNGIYKEEIRGFSRTGETSIFASVTQFVEWLENKETNISESCDAVWRHGLGL